MAPSHRPIVSREVQQQLLDTLDARRRRYGRGSTVAVRTAAALLQGGLLRCASCQRAMVAFGHSYRCRRRDELPDRDCALPANVGVKLLDTVIVDLWCATVARLPATSPARHRITREWAEHLDPPDAHGASTLRAWREARAALANADYALFARGQLDEHRYNHIVSILTARVAALERDIDAARTYQFRHGLRDPAHLRALWDDAPFEQRRRQLHNGIEQICVLKARRPGVPFEPAERLRIIWRE